MSTGVAVELEPALTDEDLRRLLQIGRSTFYRYKARGTYRHLLADPQLTPTARYSPRLVRQWLDGEGRASSVRAFGSGRRRA